MTENEALKILEDLQRLLTNYRHISKDLTEANGIAIKALEEIQAYRAIGTVKEIKIKEAQFARLSEGYLNDLTLLREYQSIGTVEDFKSLKEKNEPKEVAYQIDTSGHKHEKCPACGSFHVFGKHCTECGQSIIEWWQ